MSRSSTSFIERLFLRMIRGIFLRGWLVLCCFLVGGVLSGYTWKDGKSSSKQPPPPYMVLARQALVAKDLKAAARVMNAARRCWKLRQQACGFRFQRYLMLAGILYLEAGRSAQAVTFLKRALQELPRIPDAVSGARRKRATKKQDREAKARTKAQAQRQKRLRFSNWFYLGQALFRVRRFREAAKALERAEPVGKSIEGFFGLLARSWWRAGEPTRARQVLQEALKRFPRRQRLWREAVLLFARVGLFETAVSRARLLQAWAPKLSLSLQLRVVDLMRQKKLSRQVLPVLEAMRIQWPGRPAILRRLGVVYGRLRMFRAAGKCFGLLAAREPEMAYYASSAYLQASAYPFAASWALRIPDSKKRRLQRARIFLQQQDFVRVFALLWPLAQKQSLKPVMRYRLAYAAIQIGRLESAKTLLRRLKGTPMRENAARLMRALARCEKTPWACTSP